MVALDVEERPWEDQFALDDASYREQVSYVLERSPFYRRKLADAGIESAADAGGLEQIAGLPTTDKRELRATATLENPLGAHLCAPDCEIVRI
jgi:phenylacetate-CoA ligase